MTLMHKSCIAIIIMFLLHSMNLYGERYIVTSVLGPTYYAGYGYKGSNNIVHWSNNSVDWYLNSGGAGDGFTFNETKSFIEDAYTEWTSVSSTNFSASYQGSTTRTNGNDGFNVHFWDETGSVFTGAISGATAVVILTRNSDHELVDVDVAYNGSKTWYDNGNNWNDILSVAIHEIGHSFGLHHTNVSTNQPVMVASVSTPTPDRRTVEFDDEEGISFLYGGNLIDNETFSGTDYYKWDLSVASGKSLTINSNAVLYFSSGKKLTVNGTLDVNGSSGSEVTFTRSGASGSWGGIHFNAGSTGSIEFADITHTYSGIKIYSPDITLDNCNVTDFSNIGIYSYFSSAPANKPVISDCYVDWGGGVDYRYGILVETTNPRITGTTVVDAQWGLRTYQSTANCENGYNSFNDNQYGVYSNNSSLNLGSSSNGNNDFSGNSSYNMYAYNGGSTDAENNWWGTTSENLTQMKLFIGSGTTVDYSPIRTSDPTSPAMNFSVGYVSEGSRRFLSKTDGLANLLHEKIRIAKSYLSMQKYEEAFQICKEIIENYPESKEAVDAFFIISELLGYVELSSVNDYLSNKSMSNENYFVNGLLDLLYVNYTKSDKKLRYNLLLKKYKSNPVQEHIYYQLILYLTHIEDDKKEAEKKLKMFEKDFPNSDLIETAYNHLGLDHRTTQATMIQKTEIESGLTNDFKVLGNYPNPFNPSTVIKYALPISSNVKLTIYNIMGQEVKSFEVNGVSEGIHQFNWDGTNMNNQRVASGIYIYRIHAVGNDGRVFDQSAKMSLLK